MIAAGVAEAALDLSIVDDATIHALNRDYAGEDHATDVLSFSQREGLALPTPGEHLGDIIIALPYASRQATAAGHALVDELVHLAVHGLAHLCGYDHRTKRQEQVMFGYEAALRASARAVGAVVAVTAPRARTASPSPTRAGSPPKARRDRAVRRTTTRR